MGGLRLGEFARGTDGVREAARGAHGSTKGRQVSCPYNQTNISHLLFEHGLAAILDGYHRAWRHRRKVHLRADARRKYAAETAPWRAPPERRLDAPTVQGRHRFSALLDSFLT